MIRRVVIAFAAATSFCATTSSFAAEAFTSNIPPFSIENGPRVGFVREIVSEIAKRLGAEIPIIYGKSWPQSQEEAKSRLDTLVFPLGRTSAREPHYQWVLKIVDMDVAFATAPAAAAPVPMRMKSRRDSGNFAIHVLLRAFKSRSSEAFGVNFLGDSLF